MKSLTLYINEKLHVSKYKKEKPDNKIPELTGDKVTDKILYGWGLGTEEPDAIEAIQKWIKDNNIDDIELAADKETLNETDMPQAIKELYNDSYKTNEECQWRLNSAKEIYSFGRMTQIYASPDLIAFIGPTGTLYAIPSYTL